jgi:hypothetical protein
MVNPGVGKAVSLHSAHTTQEQLDEGLDWKASPKLPINLSPEGRSFIGTRAVSKTSDQTLNNKLL